MLAGLLTKYSTVFSTGDGDVGHTALVEHTIPVMEGIRLVHLQPHQLGLDKKAKAEKQVQDLLKKRLVVPGVPLWY